LKFDSGERATFEREKSPLQTRMNQAFDRPNIAVLLFVARKNLRLRAFQHRFDARSGIVPTKTERWRQFFSGVCTNAREKQQKKRKNLPSDHQQRK
jgi:hypothetical protein